MQHSLQPSHALWASLRTCHLHFLQCSVSSDQQPHPYGRCYWSWITQCKVVFWFYDPLSSLFTISFLYRECQEDKVFQDLLKMGVGLQERLLEASLNDEVELITDLVSWWNKPINSMLSPFMPLVDSEGGQCLSSGWYQRVESGNHRLDNTTRWKFVSTLEPKGQVWPWLQSRTYRWIAVPCQHWLV
jgi:hypothetical protein